MLSIIKIRRTFKLFENVQSREELQTLIRNPETRGAAIEMIASENHIPRFLATTIYNKIMKTVDVQKDEPANRYAWVYQSSGLKLVKIYPAVYKEETWPFP